jgi:manganese transport protein
MAKASEGDVGSLDSIDKYAPFVRPVVFVALGYMDPGNWATAIEGGSRFGFELLWVVVLSNMMAVLFQTLAIRLELVTGKRLTQVHSFAPSIVLLLSFWVPLFLCVE